MALHENNTHMSIVLKGTIDSLEEREGKDTGSISVRLGPKPRKDSDGMTVGPFPRTLHLDVPSGKIRDFHIGDKVEVELRKPGAASKLEGVRRRRGR